MEKNLIIFLLLACSCCSCPLLSMETNGSNNVITKTYQIPQLAIAPVKGFVNRIRNIFWPSIPQLAVIKSPITITKQADSSNFEVTKGSDTTTSDDITNKDTTTSDDITNKDTTTSDDITNLVQPMKKSTEPFSRRTLRHSTSRQLSKRLRMYSAAALGCGVFTILNKLKCKISGMVAIAPAFLAIAAAGTGYYFLPEESFFHYFNKHLKKTPLTDPLLKANSEARTEYRNGYTDLHRQISNDFDLTMLK